MESQGWDTEKALRLYQAAAYQLPPTDPIEAPVNLILSLLPKTTADMAAAMHEAGEAPATAHARPVAGDGTVMPFGSAVFDRVIAAEVLEHIGDDQRALNEIARVLRPGGLLAVTVPAWLPERICWRLSDDYHNVPGGHVPFRAVRAEHVKLCPIQDR